MGNDPTSTKSRIGKPPFYWHPPWPADNHSGTYARRLCRPARNRLDNESSSSWPNTLNSQPYWLCECIATHIRICKFTRLTCKPGYSEARSSFAWNYWLKCNGRGVAWGLLCIKYSLFVSSSALQTGMKARVYGHPQYASFGVLRGFRSEGGWSGEQGLLLIRSLFIFLGFGWNCFDILNHLDRVENVFC